MRALEHRIDHLLHGDDGRVRIIADALDHAALLTLALLESQLGGGPQYGATDADIERVRRRCVFTTHTPVTAGHDRFSTEQTIRILGGDRTAQLEKLGCFRDGLLNMTLLALRFSRYANGVAMQHGKVSRAMFPELQGAGEAEAALRAAGESPVKIGEIVEAEGERVLMNGALRL